MLLCSLIPQDFIPDPSTKSCSPGHHCHHLEWLLGAKMEILGLLWPEGNLLEAEQFAKCQQLPGGTCDTSGGVSEGNPRFWWKPPGLGVLGDPRFGSLGFVPQELGGSSPCPRAGSVLKGSSRPHRGICRAGSSVIRGMQMGRREKVPGKGKAAHEREHRQERGNYSHSPKVYF